MAIYLIKLPTDFVGTLREGANAMVVSAGNQSQAEKACAAKFAGFASTAAWDNATATSFSDVSAASTDSLVGFRFRVVVTGAAGQTASADPVDVIVTGVKGAGTIDTIAAKLVTLLNATPGISNASYDEASQVLTLASGGGGDDLGDAKVSVEVYQPLEFDNNGVQTNKDVAQPDFVTACHR